MQNQVISAKSKGTLNLAAKRRHAILANIFSLATNIYQVACMNNKRPDIERRAKGPHPLRLLGVNLGRTPHARAGRKKLKRISANLPRPLNRVRSPAGRPQMHPNPFCHADSVLTQACKLKLLEAVILSEGSHKPRRALFNRDRSSLRRPKLNARQERRPPHRRRLQKITTLWHTLAHRRLRGRQSKWVNKNGTPTPSFTKRPF